MKPNLIHWILFFFLAFADCTFAQEPEYNDAEKDQAIQNIHIYAANVNYPFNLSYVVYSSLAQPNRKCLFYCHHPFIVEFSYTDFIYSIGYDDPLPEYYYTIAVEIRNATGQPIKTFYPVFSGRTQTLAPNQPKSVLQLPAGEYSVYLNGTINEIGIDMEEEAAEEEAAEEEVEAAAAEEAEEEDESGSNSGPRFQTRMSERPSPAFYIGMTLRATFFPEYDDPLLGGDTIPQLNRSFAYSDFMPQYSGGRNIIREYTSTNGTIDENAEGYCHTSIYDDFGRLRFDIQSKFVQDMDLVTRHDLDLYGNRVRSWLPVVMPHDSTLTAFDTLFETQCGITYDDNRPFTDFEYELWPGGRLRQQSGPGDIWARDSKAINTEYLTNIAQNDTLKCYRIRMFMPSSYQAEEYPSGSLSVSRNSDEDGHTILTFNDSEDRTILERRIEHVASDVKCYDTYYVYDNLDRLIAVLPPNLSAALPSADISAAYLYRYSQNDLLIARKYPNIKWEYIVYDDERNPVFTQNGNDRAQGIWRFRISDSAGRECLTGICENDFDPFISPCHLAAIKCVYMGSEGIYQGYNVNGIYLKNPQIQSVTYYDHYHFLDAGIFPSSASFRFVDHTTDNFPARHTSARGQVTGSIEMHLNGTEEYTPDYRTYYYDSRGQVIQVRKGNAAGIYFTEDFAYNHIGNVLMHRETCAPTVNSEADVLFSQYNYDSHGRFLNVATRLNDGHESTISNTYNYLGQLKSRRYGTNQNAITDSLTYNIRGWLTSQKNDLFQMSLAYEGPRLSMTKPSYTGNISEWTFRHDTDPEITYAFSYDALSRLTDTRQYASGSVCDLFVEKGITYDRNGNILTLQRTGNGAITDNLSYTYAGNQLTALSGTTQGTYSYDANGNMIHDGANGLDISYNRLNLTEKIELDSTILAKYTYLSDGTKFSVTDTDGNGLYYSGSLVYRKQNEDYFLESAAFHGGRITATDAGFETHYHLTDHLGSVRVIVNENGEVIEQNNYYPFGMRWNDPESQTSDNRYRYSGKEDQSFVNVPYLDFGARLYDSRFRIGWSAVDPKLEEYAYTGPYVFCADNPLNFIDPDGMDIWEINQNGKTVNRVEDKTQDTSFMIDNAGERMEGDMYSVPFEYSPVKEDSEIEYEIAGLNYNLTPFDSVDLPLYAPSENSTVFLNEVLDSEHQWLDEKGIYNLSQSVLTDSLTSIKVNFDSALKETGLNKSLAKKYRCVFYQEKLFLLEETNECPCNNFIIYYINHSFFYNLQSLSWTRYDEIKNYSFRISEEKGNDAKNGAF